MKTSEARVRFAAVLIVAGLVTELLTLRWTHPTAFLIFVHVGGLCLGAGTALFLTTLFRAPDPS